MLARKSRNSSHFRQRAGCYQETLTHLTCESPRNLVAVSATTSFAKERDE